MPQKAADEGRLGSVITNSGIVPALAKIAANDVGVQVPPGSPLLRFTG